MACPFHVLFFNVGGDYFAVINWWSSLVWQVLQNSPFLTFIPLCRAFLLIWKKLVLSGPHSSLRVLHFYFLFLLFLSRYYQLNILSFWGSVAEVNYLEEIIRLGGGESVLEVCVLFDSSPILVTLHIHCLFWDTTTEFSFKEQKHIFLDVFSRPG